MDRLQEKTTAPYPPVGADGGQSLSQKPNQSIAEGVTEHKPPERDLEEILRQISRVNDPAYLPTVSCARRRTFLTGESPESARQRERYSQRQGCPS